MVASVRKDIGGLEVLPEAIEVEQPAGWPGSPQLQREALQSVRLRRQIVRHPPVIGEAFRDQLGQTSRMQQAAGDAGYEGLAGTGQHGQAGP